LLHFNQSAETTSKANALQFDNLPTFPDFCNSCFETTSKPAEVKAYPERSFEKENGK